MFLRLLKHINPGLKYYYYYYNPMSNVNLTIFYHVTSSSSFISFLLRKARAPTSLCQIRIVRFLISTRMIARTRDTIEFNTCLFIITFFLRLVYYLYILYIYRCWQQKTDRPFRIRFEIRKTNVPIN